MTQDLIKGNFKEEVAGLFALIEQNRLENKKNYDDSNKQKDEKKTDKITLIVLLVIGIIWLALTLSPKSFLSQIDGIRLVLQLLVVFVYLLVGVSFFYQYRSVK